MDKFQTYVEANRDRFIAELQEFCRSPSVAAQNLGMLEMADKVLACLKELGAEIILGLDPPNHFTTSPALSKVELAMIG